MLRADTWEAPRRAVAAVRDSVAWPHPEWWALMVSAVAWILLIVPHAIALAGAPDHDHHAPASLPGASSVVLDARDWLLMIVAMMFPLSVASIQATAARSLWRRRHRAIAWWLGGYITPWFILGVVVSLCTTLLSIEPLAGSSATAALAFMVAGLWQISSARALSLKRCHRTQPLAPSGWRANCDCVRYGWTTGVYCVATCGVLMVACWLLGHGALGLAGMMAGMTISLAERYMIRPNQRWLAAALGLMAVVAASTASW